MVNVTISVDAFNIDLARKTIQSMLDNYIPKERSTILGGPLGCRGPDETKSFSGYFRIAGNLPEEKERRHDDLFQENLRR